MSGQSIISPVLETRVGFLWILSPNLCLLPFHAVQTILDILFRTQIERLMEGLAPIAFRVAAPRSSHTYFVGVQS